MAELDFRQSTVASRAVGGGSTVSAHPFDVDVRCAHRYL